MTLIASTFSQELPFILGDLLFSSIEGKPYFITPTQIPIFPESHKNSGYKPHSLNQKIYILRDNLAVALAGNSFQMKTFLRELKMRLQYGVIERESIERFLIDFDMGVNFSESAMLMMLVLPHDSESNFVNRFSFGNWSKEEHQHFGSVWAIGSGAQSFLSQFKEPTSFETDAQLGTVQYAIIANLGLLAKWLAIEKGSGITLKDSWGAGFEMIFYDGKKFEKFQEICFVIFEGRSDENGITEFVFPTVVMYQHYKNDILYITSLRLMEGVSSEIDNNICYYCDNLETNFFVVTPIDSDHEGTVEVKENHSFQSFTISAGYSIINHDQGMYNPTYFLRDGTVSVNFSDSQTDSQKIEIKVPIEINHQILASAKAAFDFENSRLQ